MEWSNSDPTASRTITFGTEPADPMPPSANVTVDVDGARHAVINPTANSAHSGFIVAAPQERAPSVASGRHAIPRDLYTCGDLPLYTRSL